MRISDWSSDVCSSDLGAFEITQPIQMRFNELIAGVRGDIAVKVFGDDTDAMNAMANAIAAVLRKTEGAVDVRVEQTEGLPMLDIRPRRDILSRPGITAQRSAARRGGKERVSTCRTGGW